jgi:rhamnogalacturonyl hydrolase YesR
VRDGSHSGSNFAQAGDLQVKQVAAPGYTRESYLRFDLTGVGSADQISSAVVRLFGRKLDAVAPRVTVGLYPVSNAAWSEPGLTWNTRPAAGAAPVATVAISSTAGAVHTFDVSQYLKQQKAAGATAVAFALKATTAGEGWAGFNSDEAPSNRPALVVTHGVGSTLAQKVAQAATFADQQLRRTLTDLGGATTAWPHTTRTDGSWFTKPRDEWTSGFFPGAMWQMYRRTGDAFWKDKATASTLGLRGNETLPEDNHFRTFIPFAPLYEATTDPQYRDILLRAAASKSAQFHNTVGAFKASWRTSTSGDPRANFGVLMDHMMDLELLFWAARQTGNQAYYNQALRNAQTVATHLVRADGGSYHWGYFDSATGEFISGETAQGYANESTWARGQAWGIYAFTMVYRETRDAQFLATARKMADYFLRNLPADQVPFWDFNDPAIPDTHKDSSAAAIAASGLFELAKLDPPNAETYGRAAEGILGALTAQPYLAQGTNSRAVLNRGAWYVPPPVSSGESSTIWGDYYFLEAINRFEGR